MSQNETWTAAASPPRHPFTTRVAAGVTLTLEPCATVLFKQGTSLELFSEGSRLVTEGTASKPIQFAGEEGTPWGALRVSHPAHATLRHVKLSGGGGERFADSATLLGRSRVQRNGGPGNEAGARRAGVHRQ